MKKWFVFAALLPCLAFLFVPAGNAAETEVSGDEAPEAVASVDILSDDVLSGDVLSGDVVSDDDDAENAIDELMRSLFQSDYRVFDATPYGMQDPGLEGNYLIIQEEGGNLEAGGVDRIRLISFRKSDGIYDRALLLEIAPSDGEPFLVPLSEDVKGFESRIELKNFISADKSEIMLTVKKGGGGIERFLIIEIRERQGHVIYDSQASDFPAFRGKFFDQYRAEIIIPETGFRTMIDLSSRKLHYDRARIYNESTGRLRTGITVWKSQHSLLQPVDVDNDGIYELQGVAELCGAGRNDRIAYLESTLKYGDGKWQVLDSWIAPAEDLANLPMPKRVN